MINNRKEEMNLEKQKYSAIEKKIKSLRFPWWCKIIAYILSHILMAASSALVIIKGIEFGDQMVGKWLTSLLIAFLSSIFLTQPLKVRLKR